MPTLHSPAAQVIGSRIRDARRAQGITMEDLSELAEVSHATVGKIERGVQSPSVETLIRLAAALEIEAGEVLRGVTVEDYGASREHRYTVRDFKRAEAEHRARKRREKSG